MKLFVCISVILVLSILNQDSNASFLYGQPCSERNTAYLYPTSWRLPQQNITNCVDVTGFKKSIAENAKINFTHFMKRVSMADTLYADHMDLQRLPIYLVMSLPNVETIDMSGNQIRRLPNRIHKVAPRLLKFMLSDNMVTVPKMKPLLSSPSLQTLMLSNNKINRIYRNTFARLPALEVLYLDSNKLRHITADMFKHMPKLQYLHLGKNYLSIVPPKSSISRSLVYYITKSQRQLK